MTPLRAEVGNVNCFQAAVNILCVVLCWFLPCRQCVLDGKCCTKSHCPFFRDSAIVFKNVCLNILMNTGSEVFCLF